MQLTLDKIFYAGNNINCEDLQNITETSFEKLGNVLEMKHFENTFSHFFNHLYKT